MEYKFTSDNFESEVISSDKPVLVDFFATWCGPCRMMAPAVEELADKYEGKVKIGKLDVDQAREIAMRYGIRSIPFFGFFKNGELVDSVLGAVPASELEERLDKLA